MRDDVAQLMAFVRGARTIGDAADTITAFISTSWLRGDRLLCGDCHDMRGAESEHRSQEGNCDGCGSKVAALWEWRLEDLPPFALEQVDNVGWVERETAKRST